MGTKASSMPRRLCRNLCRNLYRNLCHRGHRGHHVISPLIVVLLLFVLLSWVLADQTAAVSAVGTNRAWAMAFLHTIRVADQAVGAFGQGGVVVLTELDKDEVLFPTRRAYGVVLHAHLIDGYSAPVRTDRDSRFGYVVIAVCSLLVVDQVRVATIQCFAFDIAFTLCRDTTGMTR